MNVKPAKQQNHDGLDAVLYAVAPAAEPDTAKMQRQIQSRMIHAFTQPRKQANPYTFYWKLSYSVAAVLLMCAVWFAINHDDNLPTAVVVFTQGEGVSIIDQDGNTGSAMQNIELHSGSVIQTDGESKATFLLSDLSTIRLNSSSTLRVNSNHEIVLESGTVYADVSKRKEGQEQFVILAGEVKVLVLGTEFEVIRNEKEVRVSVTEGNVRVTTPEQSVQSLQKDHTVSYENKTLNAPQRAVSPIALWKESMNDSEVIQLMLKFFPSRSQDVFQ